MGMGRKEEEEGVVGVDGEVDEGEEWKGAGEGGEDISAKEAGKEGAKGESSVL